MTAQPWQLVSIPVNGGVDLRTDSARVQPPKVLAAEDASLDVPGRARKRPGRRRKTPATYQMNQFSMGDAGTLVSAAKQNVPIREARWLGVQPNGRALLHADGALLAESGGRWFHRGYIDQIRVTARNLISDNGEGTVSLVDMAVAGDIAVVAWGNASQSYVRFIVYDLATMAPIIESSPAAAVLKKPRLVGIPGTGTVYLFYLDGANLRCIPIQSSTIRTADLLTYDASIGSLKAQTPVTDVGAGLLYDVAIVGDRIALAYVNTGGDVKLGYVEQNGKAEGTYATEVPGAAVVAVAVHHSTAKDKTLLGWASDASTFVKIREWTAAATTFTSGTLTTVDAAAPATIKQLALHGRSEFWIVLYETGGVTLHNRIVNVRAVGTAGVRNITVVRHASLTSKPWMDSATNRFYAVMVYENQTQPAAQVTYFVWSASPGTEGISSGGQFINPPYNENVRLVVGSFWQGFAGGVWPTTHLAAVTVVGRKAYFALPYRVRQNETSKTLLPRPIMIEHAPFDMQALIPGPDASYAPGGVLWRIDDAICAQFSGEVAKAAAEAGFLLAPENCSGVGLNLGGGGLLASTSYTYRPYYRDLATGERSAAGPPYTVNTGVGNNAVRHTLQTLNATNHGLVVIDLYRTVGNPLANPFFFLATTVYNSLGADTVTIDDVVGDTALQSRERDYLTLGEVMEGGPPANAVIAVGDGRVALAGFAEDDGLILVSKLRGAGEPIRWSPFLRVQADSPTPGPIVGMAWRAADLIIWRRRSIQVVSGRGPDNAGQGGVADPAQTISFEVGMGSARSLVRIPQGWIFQALDGTYWMLGLDLQLSYVGADVEPLKDSCTGAFVIQAQKQARFVTATRTLVYHYDNGGWTIWPFAAVSGAVLPDGTGLYLPSASSAVVLEDDPTGYRDDGAEYHHRLELPWFRPGGQQGEILVRRILFAGGYEGKHRPLVRVAYDYEPGFNDSYEWDADNVVATVIQGDGTAVFGGESRLNVATQRYQFSVPLARQRCMAIKVEILDQSAGGANQLGASYWLSDVAFEVAPAGVGHQDEERRRAT